MLRRRKTCWYIEWKKIFHHDFYINYKSKTGSIAGFFQIVCFLRNEDLNNEQELLEKVAQGNEAAFGQLFNSHRDRIYTIAFKISKSSVIAEEIVQDVFLRIWQRRATLPAIQNFSAYLFIITRNDVCKALKGIANGYKISLLSEDSYSKEFNPVEDPLLEKEYDLVLRNAISRLPSQQKTVYHLIKDRGLKRDEVACQLRIQPETVKYHLAQAMKNIRAFCMLYLGVLFSFCILFYRFFSF